MPEMPKTYYTEDWDGCPDACWANCPHCHNDAEHNEGALVKVKEPDQHGRGLAFYQWKCQRCGAEFKSKYPSVMFIGGSLLT